jgi:hypothetical protein
VLERWGEGNVVKAVMYVGEIWQARLAVCAAAASPSGTAHPRRYLPHVHMKELCAQQTW